MRPNRYMGFLGFLGLEGFVGIASGNTTQTLWLLWFIWFIYFIPKEKRNKKVLTTLILGLCIITAAATFFVYRQPDGTQVKSTSQTQIEAITQNVSDFGTKIQNVSLSAKYADAQKAIDENYRPFVSSQLLAKWKNDPLSAPGRLTSSPWPDRIEISHILKTATSTYIVEGTVIEIARAADNMTAVAAEYPVSLTLQYQNNTWVITSFTKGKYIHL